MYGQEFGAILPNPQRNPLDTYEALRQQQKAEERYQQEQERLKQANADEWLKLAAQRLDPSHWDKVGGPYDPIINATLGAALPEIAKRLKENPDDHAGVLMGIGDVVGKVEAYSNVAKQIKLQNSERAKEYAKVPGFDAARQAHLANMLAFYQYDDKGHIVGVKSPSEVDTDTDYMGMALSKYPDQIIQNDDYFRSFLNNHKGLRPEKYERTLDNKGVKRVVGYEGKYNPLYSELVDEVGNPVAPGKQKAVGTRVKQEVLPDGSAIAAKDVYQSFVSDPVNDAWLTKEAMKTGVNRYDPNLDLAKRKILLTELQNGPDVINKVKDVEDYSQRESEDFRRTMLVFARSIAGKDGPSINDLFGGIKTKFNSTPQRSAMSLSELTPQQQEALIKVGKMAIGDKIYSRGGILRERGIDDFYVGRNANNDLALFAKFDENGKPVNKEIGPLDYTSININRQANSKGKESVIKQGNKQPSGTPSWMTDPNTKKVK